MGVFKYILKDVLGCVFSSRRAKKKINLSLLCCLFMLLTYSLNSLGCCSHPVPGGLKDLSTWLWHEWEAGVGLPSRGGGGGAG